MKQIGVLLLAAASWVAAEGVLDFTKLPACAAQQCTILQQADASCVPPAAPVTNQEIYQSCVCQSALLTGLRTSGAICQQMGCSADDATKISQYYIGLCAGPPVKPAPTSTAAPTGTTLTTSTLPTNTVGTGGASGQGARVTEEKKSWIEGHWKWVVMLAVIAVAMVVFWVGGIYVRRHFDRKRDAKRANLAASHGPMNAGTPGSNSSTSAAMAQPEMSGANGHGPKAFDGAVAAGGPKMRSRTNTLQSLRRNSSRVTIPQPVVWGPHQHQAAYANTNGRNSPGVSVPPSPTSAIGSPHPFRNRESNRSVSRMNSSRSQEVINGPVPGVAAENHRYTDAMRQAHTSHGTGDTGRGLTDWGVTGNEIGRPQTAAAIDNPVRENSSRRTLTTVQGDPTLATHMEGQSAEIYEASSPSKSTK